MNLHDATPKTKFDPGTRVRLSRTGWMAANGTTGTVTGQRYMFGEIFTTIRLDDPKLYGQNGQVHATPHEFELI